MMIRLDPFLGSEQNAALKFWRLPAEHALLLIVLSPSLSLCLATVHRWQPGAIGLRGMRMIRVQRSGCVSVPSRRWTRPSGRSGIPTTGPDRTGLAETRWYPSPGRRNGSDRRRVGLQDDGIREAPEPDPRRRREMAEWTGNERTPGPEVVGTEHSEWTRRRELEDFPYLAESSRRRLAVLRRCPTPLTMLATALAFGLGLLPMSTRADGLTSNSNTSNTHDRVAGIYPDDDPGHPRRHGFAARRGPHAPLAADPGARSRPSPSSNRRAPAPPRSRSSPTRPGTISTTRRSFRSGSGTTPMTARRSPHRHSA